MTRTGFSTPFYIRRKRNVYSIPFLMYLDGRDSGAATWTDKEDTDVDASVGGSMQLAPYGYLPDGVNDYLSDNLGVNGVTINKFTIAVIVTRNEMSNNEGIIQGLFGDTHYPRLYFNGTTLNAKVRLDGTIRTVSVSNVDTYLKPGQPHFIVFRGDAAVGLEVLIDGVSRGTDSNTGTSYNTSNGTFNLGKDSNLSYFEKGNLRFVAVTARWLTDEQLATWRTMLEYEGHFDIWRDTFSKWSSNTSFTSGVNQVASSPYVANVVES